MNGFDDFDVDAILSEFLEQESEAKDVVEGNSESNPIDRFHQYEKKAERPILHGEEPAIITEPQQKEESFEPRAVPKIEDSEKIRRRIKKNQEESPEPSQGSETMRSLFFAILSVLVLCWAAVNVHPDSTAAAVSKGNTSADIVHRIDNFAANAKVDVLSTVAAEQIPVIRKVYKIPESEKVAPKPNPAAYGTLSTGSASEVMNVIRKAEESGLLDGQKVLFDPNADFYYDSDIQYYYDDTILVICWKEMIEGRVTSCAEVKIADGSQIRRKLCEDTYGSSVYLYCTELAAQANAVIAMNSDYYAFRDLGITCYDRQVYRFNDYGYYLNYKAYNVTDTLFINSEGDFIFFYRGTETTAEELQKWVDENDILYSIAFGPILVDNGEQRIIDDYPCGEINLEYSRAGIAQVDKLHYLYMAVSHSNDGTPRCTVNEFGAFMAAKGVQKGYCFDGGQTGEVVMNGVPYNHIDFGNERTVSDILYFATALPESEAMK